MLIPFLLKEKIIRLSEVKKDPKKLRGFVRVVNDNNGMSTKGFFMDPETFEDLLEYLEYQTPEFWKEIEESKKSGIVSAKEIEKRLGL
ncbi:hypothetical protein HY468_04290 [Candidatus Roizmanbacteria bacterium]|nr:hypothetical protein [Candidatus Roizmanbacteria bacterium]